MKHFKYITFCLLLALSITAIVFTSCTDDEDDPIAVTAISLDVTTLSLETDCSYTLTATISPDNASDKTITWTSSDTSTATVTDGKVTAIAAGTVTITATAGDITMTCTVAISKTQINTDGVSGTLTDAEGNSYAIVKIGDQWWMAANLKATKYNDGTSIPDITDNTAWAALTTGAYCSYNNDTDNGTKYGMLYNWYAVGTGKLAPAGWHVATDDEWTTLNTYVTSNTGTSGSGAKALAATTDWTSSTTTGAPGNDLTTNNSIGFSALPGGYRNGDGSFYSRSYFGYWWTTAEYATTNAKYRYLYYNSAYLKSSEDSKGGGFSVRCVKD